MLVTNVTGHRIVSSIACLMKKNYDLFIEACTAILMDLVSHRRTVFEG
jgi:hypothetical protein